MSRRGAVGVVVVCGLAAAGVFVGGPVSAAPVVVLDEEQLASALLTPATARGPGWTAAEPDVIEREPRTLANDVEGGWCGGATDAYAAGELQVAATAETTLTKTVAPDEPLWFLWTKAYSFPDVARAKSFLETIAAAEGSCDSWVIEGEPVNGISVDPLGIPMVGNETLAFRATTAGDGVTEVRDYVYVRLRNNVVVTHTRILPPDDALVVRIARTARKSLKQAVKAAA